VRYFHPLLDITLETPSREHGTCLRECFWQNWCRQTVFCV